MTMLFVAIIVLIVLSCVSAIPITAICLSHQRQMAKLKGQGMGDSSALASMEALREEVHALRDTATQYDLSFDSALQRMEQRVERLESSAYSQRTEQASTLRARNGE